MNVAPGRVKAHVFRERNAFRIGVICPSNKARPIAFDPADPYGKSERVIHKSDEPLTTFSPNSFRPTLLGLLLLTQPFPGCTVVQDYGEDYLEWRDLGTDTNIQPADDTGSQTDATTDTSEFVDALLADTSDTLSPNQPDGSLVDIDDTQVPADTGNNVKNDAAAGSLVWSKDALFDVRGYIRLIEFHDLVQGSKWQTAAHEVRVRIHPQIPSNKLGLVEESGACKLYLLDQVACPPPCLNTVTNGLNIGQISIGGLSSVAADKLTLAYGQDGEYSVQGNPVKGANLFEPEDTIVVQIEGSADLESLDLFVKGVSDMTHNNSQVVTLNDAEDYVFSWEPTGKDEVVELVLKTGPWIANQVPEGIITCAADDADGSITIPAQLIQKYPYFDGLSNDQHPSMVRRVSRNVIETEEGPLDVSVISESFLRTVH